MGNWSLEETARVDGRLMDGMCLTILGILERGPLPFGGEFLKTESLVLKDFFDLN